MGLVNVSPPDDSGIPLDSRSTWTACDAAQCSECITVSSQCTLCADPSKYATPTGTCVTTCPEGAYTSSVDKRCLPCPADCATCSPAGRCLSCSPGSPVMNPSSGRCGSTCPSSTFWQVSMSSCVSCFANCTSCTGPGETQCLSCTAGSILKGGSCGYGPCQVAQDLGVCFQDDNDNGNTWWPWLLSVMLLLAIFGTVAWWIYRSRRQRRETTAAFAATLDDKEIDKRMAGLAGVFQILNPHKSHNRTPSRENFLPSNNARSTYREPQLPGLQEHDEYSSPYLVQPPAYQSSPNLTCIDVKEPTLPDALQAGPRRAPFKDRPTIADTVNAFDGGKRPFTNRIPSWVDSRDDGTDINEWLKDDDNGSIPLNDRNPFKIV